MLSPALAETFWTLAVILLLLVATVAALLGLPWSDKEIGAVHRTVLALLLPRPSAPAADGAAS